MKKCLSCGKLCGDDLHFCTECGSSEFAPVKNKKERNRSKMGKAGRGACLILICSLLLIVFSGLALAFSGMYSTELLNSMGFRKYERYSAKIGAAVNMFSAGKYDDAEALYLDAAEIIEDREEAYVGLTNVYTVTGRLSDAALALEKLRTNTNDVQTRISTEESIASLAAYEASYTALSTAFAQDGEDISEEINSVMENNRYNTPEFYELLGDVYYRYCDNEKALAAYTAAIKQYPQGSLGAFIGAAEIYSETGESKLLADTLKRGYRYTVSDELSPEKYGYIPNISWRLEPEYEAEEIISIDSSDFPELRQFSFYTTSVGTGVINRLGRMQIQTYENAFWDDSLGICTLSDTGEVISYKAEGDILTPNTESMGTEITDDGVYTVYDPETGLVTNPVRLSYAPEGNGSYAYILPCASVDSERKTEGGYVYNYEYSGKYVVADFYEPYTGENSVPSLNDNDSTGILVRNETVFTDYKLPGSNCREASTESIYRKDGSFNSFSGFAAVKLESGKWTFINANGKLLDIGLFDDAEAFSDGVAAVKKGEKWAYITSSGELLTPYIFGSAEPAHDSLAWVKYEGKWGVVDLRGKRDAVGHIVTPYSSENISSEEQESIDANPVLCSVNNESKDKPEYAAYSRLCYEQTENYGNAVIAAVSIDMNGNGVDELLLYTKEPGRISEDGNAVPEKLYESLYTYENGNVLWQHRYCVSENLKDGEGQYWLNIGKKPHTWDGFASFTYFERRFIRNVYNSDEAAYSEYMNGEDPSALGDALCREAQYKEEFGELSEYSNIISFYMDSGEIKYRISENSPGYSSGNDIGIEEEKLEAKKGVLFSADDSSAEKWEYYKYSELCAELVNEYGMADSELENSGVVLGLSYDLDNDGCDELLLYRLQNKNDGSGIEAVQELYKLISGKVFRISEDVVCSDGAQLSTYTLLDGKLPHAFSSFSGRYQNSVSPGIWILEDNILSCEDCALYEAEDFSVLNSSASATKKASVRYSALKRGHEAYAGDLSSYIPLISFECHDSGNIVLYVGSSGSNEYGEEDIAYSSLSDIRSSSERSED